MSSRLAVFRLGLGARHWSTALALLAAVVSGSAAWVDDVFADEPPAAVKAPELTGVSRWINSDGIALADQKGKVVVLHFWAFACSNCQRNLPAYNQWRKDFAKDEVVVIGIHTPETAAEADAQKVAAQVKKRKITYPVAVDNDGAVWKAYENRYWPSVYLIDKQGRVRFRWEGELEYQNAGGDRTLRAKIKELLTEDKP